MPSNRKIFDRAHSKWQEFKAEGQFSVPAEAGKLAIVSSYFTDEPLDTETGITELESFRSEALEIAKRTLAAGGQFDLAIDATRDDINDLVKDPEVASMVIIGNGSLSSVLLAEKDYYDWQNISDASTHLKLGSFVQRQCGGLTRVFNAPLGLFAVSDPRNIHAAYGVEFYPLSLDDPENDKIQPIFTDEHFDYEVIKAMGSVVS